MYKFLKNCIMKGTLLYIRDPSFKNIVYIPLYSFPTDLLLSRSKKSEAELFFSSLRTDHFMQNHLLIASLFVYDSLVNSPTLPARNAARLLLLIFHCPVDSLAGPASCILLLSVPLSWSWSRLLHFWSPTLEIWDTS